MSQVTSHKRVSFYTFGCRLNQSETASIQNSLEAHGYQVVDFDKPSDIVVVNTCTVTEGGDADTRRLVNRISRTQPEAQIALVGCQAQIQKEGLASLTNVKWVVGNARKMDLADVFSRNPKPQSPIVDAPTIERVAFTQPVSIDREHTRANLKIQDGCDFFCSFCEIPYARGRARSRVFNDILQEANILADAGHQEIVLTGINIGTYQDNGKTFLDVIDALEKIDSIKRIRISSIEPTTIPLELFDRMNQGKVCRYLHIPLQSGDDQVLSDMKRKYTVNDFTNFIHAAYQKVAGICIGTDVIVGFPTETKESFINTEALLRDLPIHYFHVFSYSPRHMAKSRLQENIAPQIINERSQILRLLSQRKRRLFQENLIGLTQGVLFEEEKKGYWTGLTDTYVRVNVKSDISLKNRLLQVSLAAVEKEAMLGDLSYV